MRLYEPWPVPYTINSRSPYGPRKHPITRKVKFHHGVDIAMPVGTPLIAGADGRIAHKGSGASGGYTLLIEHEGGWHSVYYHLQKPSHRNIGEQVQAGDLVANSGNTGASTGPHLHFELRRSRRWGDTVNPVSHFQGKYRREKPQEVPTPPKPRVRVPMPVYGISGRFRAEDARAVASFMRGRR
jgi:murein DD-endopeptidase MepM/ murein hydrolase activator NlpD